MASSAVEAPSQASVALGLARERLLALQHEGGWWQGELQTNVTMDAEDMLLREFLGVRTEDETRRSAAWIRSQQRADGTWANFHGGPGELSTTIEAYWALRLAGDEPEAEHMQAAASFIRAAGGLARARVFTHVWLALFGLWSWEEVPALPPEIILLPRWVPLNVYDFACWARQTIVALSLVKAHRPERRLSFDLDELRNPLPADPSRPRGGGLCSTRRTRWLRRLDRLLGEEVRQHGDWSVARPGLEPGGWAFEFANVNYPDVDDTAEVVLALHCAATTSQGAGAARHADESNGDGGGPSERSAIAAR